MLRTKSTRSLGSIKPFNPICLHNIVQIVNYKKTKQHTIQPQKTSHGQKPISHMLIVKNKREKQHEDTLRFGVDKL